MPHGTGKILNIPIKKVAFPVTRKITDIVPDGEDIRLDACINDETTEIFLSTKGKKDDVDDEMKDFLAYIENSTDTCVQQTSSPLVKAIHKRVTEIKLDKNMELQYMTLLQMPGGI